MPSDLSPVSMTEAPLESDTPIETRLTPDQLSELDAMNSAFGGEQLGEEADLQKDKLPGEGDGLPHSSLKPPPVATTDKLPTSIVPDEFIPPDEDGAAVVDEKEKPAVKTAADLKPASELFPDEAVDKLRTEKAKGDIKGLRQHYDTAREMLAHVEKENAELKAAKPQEADARVADLEARNAELNAIIEKHAPALKQHPFVIKNFTQPRTAAVAFAKEAIEMSEVPDGVEQFEAALNKTGREQVAAFDELYDSISSKSLRGKVEQAVAAIERINRQETDFFADRDGNRARVEREEKANQQRRLAEQETNFTKSIDRVVDFLGNEKKFTFFKRSDKPEHAKWNEALDSDIAEARELLLHNEDPMKLISVVALGTRAPRMDVAYNKILGMYKEVLAENAQLKGGRPPVLGGGIPPKPGAIDPNETLAQAGQRAIREAALG